MQWDKNVKMVKYTSIHYVSRAHLSFTNIQGTIHNYKKVLWSYKTNIFGTTLNEILKKMFIFACEAMSWAFQIALFSDFTTLCD